MKRWLVPVLVVLIIAAGVGGFFGGKASGGSAETAAAGDVAAGGPGDSMPTDGSLPSDGDGSGRTGRGFTTGSILSADGDSITIQLSDGNTQIVYLSDSTAILETTDASSDALVEGEEVTVAGSTNDDGSITARSINLGEIATGMLGGGTPPSDTGTTGTTGN